MTIVGNSIYHEYINGLHETHTHDVFVVIDYVCESKHTDEHSWLHVVLSS